MDLQQWQRSCVSIAQCKVAQLHNAHWIKAQCKPQSKCVSSAAVQVTTKTGRRSREQRADDHISKNLYIVSNRLVSESSRSYFKEIVTKIGSSVGQFPKQQIIPNIYRYVHFQQVGQLTNIYRYLRFQQVSFVKGFILLNWSREQMKSYFDELSLNQITKSMRKAGYTLQKTLLNLKSKSSWSQFSENT